VVGRKFTIPDAASLNAVGLRTVTRAPGKGTYWFGVYVRDVWGNESVKWAPEAFIVP